VQHERQDPVVRDLLVRAAREIGRSGFRGRLRDVASAERGGTVVSPTASQLLQEAVSSAYERGWQPLDLVHVVSQDLTRRATRLLGQVIWAEAVAAGAAERGSRAWLAQLAAFDAAPGDDGGDPIGSWRRLDAGRSEPWGDVVRLLAKLQGLGAISELLEPPSRWGRPGVPRLDDSSVGDPKVLARIRSLLAKAESTSYPAEAEAMAAKAQELMTRYAVDSAVLSDAAPDSVAQQVRSRRVRIDDPYARAKSQLFFGIASANGVRGVLHPEHGLVSAVGLPVDLDLVEMLFTSLLLQAHRAMALLSDSDPTTRERSFRRGFLSAYAVRVSERLQEARRCVEDDMVADRGSALVPVLARRGERVEQTYAQLFPLTRRMRSSPVDARGWRAGVAAADRADLRAGSRQERLTG
jgi:hypothetical protein